MFLLSFLFIAINENHYFRGNWSANLTILQNISRVQRSQFHIEIQDPKPFKNLYSVDAVAAFTNTTLIRFPKYRMNFYGLFDKENSMYFLAAFPYVKNISAEMIYDMVNKSSYFNTSRFLQNPKKIYTNLVHRYERNANTTPIVALSFTVTKNDLLNNTFDLPYFMDGVVILPNQSVAFTGKLFNVPFYIQEGMIFGVMTAIILVLNYLAWNSLRTNFESQSSLELLSAHTFILNFSFDFAYSLFIFEFSMSIWRFIFLYGFLFFVTVILFFAIQMVQISRIWRSQNPDTYEGTGNDFKSIFFGFFTEISFTMSAASIALSAIFQFPKVSIAYLYSFFIPQIVHSIFAPSRKKNDNLFVVLISIVRLSPIWYFCLYKNNLIEYYNPKIALYETLYVFVQALFVLLQNKFGPTFFLPSILKPKKFDYHAGELPPDTECPICMMKIKETDTWMMTPCNHCFHEECLAR
ncbi:hypothetical protein TVAG_073910 [Trichomonas vaginalis G3]|uniref:RING-type E3 ubiquitin transferase n=1 Tax=Trichomonas vaginalis (strain ATCC PRA-98 / G3) TaxID=412133 RepID=A2EEC7_TRIV3|nr:RING finger ubiquitin ligase family [Trichomonas vaginalis G3]EAY09025.1 hypothetical protein TVAG_073910 [Trichomonas vaginalis G3]KAI5496264.1 RING finger ubiquitin ligase family [Trichomonas vaginalis G3]|eukprot:XP_001321248.1 hypothetical protein [Trichomonas vaginalis G3]